MDAAYATHTLASKIGLGMAVPMAMLQAVNVARVVLDPAGFASYMGAPLVASADASWVAIYAARTAFIALLAAILLIRRDLGALRWMATAALVMPLADAWIAHRVGAPTATVARHLAIALYLGVTAAVLFVGSRPRSDRVS